MQCIDNLRFCRSGEVLSGRLDGQSLRRLSGVGCSFDGVDFELRGGVDVHGRGRLFLTVSGDIAFVCQRCLHPFSWKLDASAEFALMSGLRELEAAEGDGFDWIPIEKRMNVEELVEDQILLELPMIPRHDVCGFPHLG